MSVREKALELAAMGLPVFPCGLDKRARIKDWGNAATTDPEQVKRFFPRMASVLLIGVPAGSRSGISIIDVDPGTAATCGSIGTSSNCGTRACIGRNRVVSTCCSSTARE